MFNCLWTTVPFVLLQCPVLCRWKNWSVSYLLMNNKLLQTIEAQNNHPLICSPDLGWNCPGSAIGITWGWMAGVRADGVR